MMYFRYLELNKVFEVTKQFLRSLKSQSVFFKVYVLVNKYYTRTAENTPTVLRIPPYLLSKSNLLNNWSHNLTNHMALENSIQK
jgi:hypothetical protein